MEYRNRTVHWLLVVAAVLSAVVGLGATPAAAQPSTGRQAAPPPDGPPAHDVDELLAQARATGRVPVMVQLDVPFRPEPELAGVGVSAQREAISAARRAVTDALQAAGGQVTRTYTTLPYVAMELPAAAVEALRGSELVSGVSEDIEFRPALDQSVPHVHGDQAWTSGYDGTGQVVAVLDTGVQSSHGFLSGKVVSQACFTDRQCPNGQSSQVGAPAGEPCTGSAAACNHGTHVAGIAAGAGSSFSGVARGARLMSIRIFNDNGSGARFSDMVAALQHVYSQRTSFNIAAANLSVEGPGYTTTSQCDSAFTALRDAVNQLRAAGIATVAASGNSGYTNALGSPACISSAVSVGSTNLSDQVANSSNSASFLSLLAPGVNINSSVTGGGFSEKTGTSMAAPHVAGAWAVLRQRSPTAGVTTLLNDLRNTGVSVRDPKSNVTTPRIQVLEALRLGPPGSPTNVVATAGSGYATVAFSPPANTGGAPITGYTVITSPGGQTTPASGSPATVNGLTNGLPYTFTVRATSDLGTSAPSAPSNEIVPAEHNGLQPVTPRRILDTREGIGTGGSTAPLGGNATINLTVTGVGEVPASGVTAVALNLTVDRPTAGSFLTVWPKGQARPTASTINFVPGQTVANNVVAKVGTDGQVSIYNRFGTVDVIADVVGWYGPGVADRFQPLAPARILDTRFGTGTGGATTPVGSDSSISVRVTGVGGVPASGVTAVVLNVTATEPTANGFLAVWPNGETMPDASSLNFTTGQTVANGVVAKVGTDGRIRIYNPFGTTHVLADVVGWHGPPSAAATDRYVPLSPARILDTRASGSIGPGGAITLQVTGVGGVPATGVTAVALNLTVTEPTANGHLTVWPNGQSRPLASYINFAPGQTVANGIVVKVGTNGQVRIYNSSGNTHVVVDVVGWFVAGSAIA